MPNTQHWQHGFPHQDLVNSKVLIHCRQRFWQRDNQLLHNYADIQMLLPHVKAQQKLGWFNQQPVWLLQLLHAPESTDAVWQSLRNYLQDEWHFPMLNYASQIGTWLDEHRFCGRCGSVNDLSAGPQRVLVCPKCRLYSYPRLSPCMIVLITKGDHILLARSPRFKAGMYSVLAGFTEPGETIEQCVMREVHEEVGLTVKNIRYLASQNWAFPHSLMFAFIADYAAGDILKQEDEIEDANWYHIDQLPEISPVGTISRFLIDSYLAEQKGLTKPNIPLS